MVQSEEINLTDIEVQKSIIDLHSKAKNLHQRVNEENFDYDAAIKELDEHVARFLFLDRILANNHRYYLINIYELQIAVNHKLLNQLDETISDTIAEIKSLDKLKAVNKAYHKQIS